jgi:large subunit ribosomal protein L25
MTMQDFIKVKATIREESDLGSRKSRNLRNEGKLPAVIYGGCVNNPNINIFLDDQKCFNIMFEKKNLISKLFEIELNNGKTEIVILKDFQIDHVNQRVLHIDFIRMSKDHFVKIKVPINFTNKHKSEAIKQGAFLNVSNYFVFVKVKLGFDIPSHFIVDLENTQALNRFYVENLVSNEEMIVTPKQLICNFVSKRGKAIKA